MTRLSRLLALTLLCAAVGGRASHTAPTVFINEIHYDNTGTDAGEFVEIAGPAGTDLSGYSIVLYNGANGLRYDTDALSGTIQDQQNGFGTVSFAYPVNGIQNGSPDGVALVQGGTTVIQFLSYEGPFTAADGPASGLLSTDIGVSEDGTEALGLSLQLVGTGTTYSDFTWTAPVANTAGAVNSGQSFTGGSGPTIAIGDVIVTEGNSGTVDATFTVTVTGSHSGVSFDIATADGTATAGDDDYVPRSELAVAIPPGSSTHEFTVQVNGDVGFEPNEEFAVVLDNVSGATTSDGQGTGTITNDDAPPPVNSDVVISQVYGGGGNSGATYTHDFVELFNRGASSVSLAGWSVQYGSATGTSWSVTSLSGSIGPGQYYLVQQAAGAGGTTSLPTPDATGSIAMAAGAGKVALLNSTTPATGACPLAATTADLIGYGATANCIEGAGPAPAPSNTTAALRKRGGCLDSDNNNLDFSIGSPFPRNNATPLRSCSYTPAAVHEIQGGGSTTPLFGVDVETTGIVTARKGNGFFIQTAIDEDSDPATSQGLFIFTGSAPAVTSGDLVLARGTAGEFFNLTQLESSLPGDVVVQSSGNTLPSAVTLTTTILDPAGPPDRLEPLEGMRLHADTLVSVAPTNEFGEIFAVLPGVARPMREPGIEISLPVPPDPTSGAPDCCIPLWDENPERIMIDSDGLAGSSALPVTSNVTLSNVTGPLDFTFGDFKVLPETAPGTSGNMSGIPVPTPTADEFTVAGFNIEHFENDPTQRQKASLAIRQLLHYPDVIGHIEILDLASLQALAAQVNADAALAGDPDPAYEARLIPAGTGTQHLGFLVKTSRVEIVNVEQKLASETFTDPLTGQPALLHDRPPLVLTANVTLPGLSPRHVIVVLNHPRSFIDVELVSGDGIRVRAKRTAQAESIAALLQEYQVANPTTPVIAIGDYNAYQFNDGYTDPIAVIKGMPTLDEQIVVDASPDLVDPNFINLTDSLPAEQRYSFVFEGTPQALDHTLVNTVAAGLVSRYAIARGNADFPQGPLFASDATRPERNSDHDMPMAYFVFPPSADVSVTATSPAPVQTGSVFSYSVMVSNAGPEAASTVGLSIPTQVGLRFTSLASPAGWTCATPASGTTGAVSCEIGSLASGTSDTFILTASLDCGIADASFVVQNLSVTSATGDPEPANNVASVTVDAVNPAPTIDSVIALVVVPPIPGAPKAGAIVSDAALGSPIVNDNCAGVSVQRAGVPAGNLFPVGFTAVVYTATDSGGAVAQASTSVHVLSALESLQAIETELVAIRAANTRPPLSLRIDNALRYVRQAIAELGEAPADQAPAVANITLAIGELEEVLRRNLLDAATARSLLRRLTGASWVLAQQELEDAVSRQGRAVYIALANALIQQGNAAAAAGKYQSASSTYRLALLFALQA
jgi:predicted extracellular nuclease